MIHEPLTKQNVALWAIRRYDNPQCLSIDEFKQDMRLFSKLNRQLSKGLDKMNMNLTINYIITINNLFDVYAGTRLMFYFLDPKNYPKVKPILEKMMILPDFIPDVNLKNIENDKEIEDHLKGIL